MVVYIVEAVSIYGAITHTCWGGLPLDLTERSGAAPVGSSEMAGFPGARPNPFHDYSKANGEPDMSSSTSSAS